MITVYDICDKYSIEMIEFSSNYTGKEKENILKSLNRNLNNLAKIFDIDNHKIGCPDGKNKLSIVFTTEKMVHSVAGIKCLAVYYRPSNTIFLQKNKYFCLAHEYGHFIYNCLNNQQYNNYLKIIELKHNDPTVKTENDLIKLLNTSLVKLLKKTCIRWYTLTREDKESLIYFTKKIVKRNVLGYINDKSRKKNLRTVYKNRMLKDIESIWSDFELPPYLKYIFGEYYEKLIDFMLCENNLSGDFDYATIKDCEYGWSLDEIYFADNDELFARMFDYTAYKCLGKCWLTDGKPLKKYRVSGINENQFQPFLMKFWHNKKGGK